jgi:excisionase family DNA binding protein
MTEPPLLVDVPEACRLLSVSRTVVYELMSAGKLPYRKIGARRVLPRAGLEQFAAGDAPSGRRTRR